MHEFKLWCVLPPNWWAPGCTCGVIRSAGKPDESEVEMRVWHERHRATEAAYWLPEPPPCWRSE